MKIFNQNEWVLSPSQQQILKNRCAFSGDITLDAVEKKDLDFIPCRDNKCNIKFYFDSINNEIIVC